MDFEKFIVWSAGPGTTEFTMIKSFDGQPATSGNSAMIGLGFDSPAQVDSLHSKAMELSVVDEGAPGPRSSGFYAGYFRDLDGNKLNCFCLQADV